MTPRRLIEPARLAGTPLLRTQSDARLVDLVRAGHAAAFEAIVQRYRRPLLKYCSRLLPASRAEDAVQQTFLKAYQSMVSGDAEINLRPWLYKIAHNASLNLLRQNGWNYDQLDENFDGVQRPDQAVELRERLRATVKAVKKLPERQRDAVLLREVEGLSYEEIGAALGIGDGAVRQLLHRARATLRAGATAVTPVGLLERVAMALGSGGADPATRVAETAAGIGAGAGVVKLGAAVLATGAIATGRPSAVRSPTTPIARRRSGSRQSPPPRPQLRSQLPPDRAPRTFRPAGRIADPARAGTARADPASTGGSAMTAAATDRRATAPATATAPPGARTIRAAARAARVTNTAARATAAAGRTAATTAAATGTAARARARAATTAGAPPRAATAATITAVATAATVEARAAAARAATAAAAAVPRRHRSPLSPLRWTAQAIPPATAVSSP